MAARIDSIVEAVGNTPLVRLGNIGRDVPGVELYLKLEYRNPGGSVKDRPALSIIRDAAARGELGHGKRLIDATSGNTGVAYSLFGAAFGYPITLVMPSNVSAARKNITRAYGTEIAYSSPLEGTDGAIRMCKELVAKEPEKWFYADQYSNPANPAAHYNGTGVEILEQVGDRLTHFVAGVGTSGTLMGTTRRLREHARKITCVGVQPDDSMHGLEGMKHMATSIVPPIFDEKVADEMLFVATEHGWDMSERLAAEEGLHVGHSSGANVYAALQVAKRIKEGCIVTIACDRGDRYFTTPQWEKLYEW